MSTQPVDPQAVEETKQQIRGLVNEITSLSRQDLEPPVFYGEFLTRVVSALAAVGGAVWTRGETSGLELQYQINLRNAFPADGEDDGADQMKHARLLHRVANTGEELLVPPHSGAAGDEEGGNPTAYLLVLSPLRDDQRIAGVVEIFQRPDSPPASQRGYQKFLAQMCDLVGDYLKGRRLQQLNDWQSLASQIDRFAQHVHEGLDPRTTAYTIANEGRRLIGCDRVSVAIRRGNRCKIEAVSGQDTMDTRSNSVVLLGKLATAVMRSGEPLWYTGSTEDLPPQIETAVHNYVDETHTKSVSVLPLRKPITEVPTGDDKKDRDIHEEGEVIGTLIVEQIEDSRPPEEFQQGVELVSTHSASALSNAIEHNDLFLMPLWRSIGKARWILRARTLPKTLAIAAAVIAALLFLCLFPKSFEMEAEGKLWPVLRKEVFVREPGIVEEVIVRHGQRVAAGDPLVRIQSVDLKLAMNKAQGDLAAADESYATTERMLLRAGRTLTPVDKVDLEGRLQQAEVQRKNANQEISAIQEKMKNLTITSPIAGEVITWDVRESLQNRPVSQGQVLMTIADLGVSENGDFNPDKHWELELFMDETKMGHVRNYKPDGGVYKLRYYLESDPRNDHEGTVVEINRRADLTEEFGNAVLILAEIDENDLLDEDGKLKELPGTEVTAKVYCGKKPIGYTWFHQLIEWVYANLLF